MSYRTLLIITIIAMLIAIILFIILLVAKETTKKIAIFAAITLLLIIAELTNLITIYQMVGGLILIVILLIVAFSEEISDNAVPRVDRYVVIIFASILGLLVLSTYVTVSLQSFPINSLQSKSNLKGMNITLNREPTVMIPLYSAPGFPPRLTLITTSIYHSPNIMIKDVKLSASSESIFSFNPNFQKNSSLSITNNTSNDNYQLWAAAQHNLQVNNFTKPYTVDIIYFNRTGGFNDLSFTFDWSAKTMDLGIFSYFWIVLIGVMVSRLLSLILNKLSDAKRALKEAAKSNQKNLQMELKDLKYKISLSTNDIVWIAFSFVIALLIFSGFSGQVHLTTNILTNIALAFAFGFGFDKVLEVAKKFDDVA
jgi:hypothetical protein